MRLLQTAEMDLVAGGFNPNDYYFDSTWTQEQINAFLAEEERKYNEGLAAGDRLGQPGFEGGSASGGDVGVSYPGWDNFWM